jgi:hypothetical protein
MTQDEICPNCGADVPATAKACPECGACEQTGWSEEAYVSRLELPESSFDYQEYLRDEFGEEKRRPPGLNWLWWSVAVLLAIFMVFWVFRNFL